MKRSLVKNALTVILHKHEKSTVEQKFKNDLLLIYLVYLREKKHILCEPLFNYISFYTVKNYNQSFKNKNTIVNI